MDFHAYLGLGGEKPRVNLGRYTWPPENTRLAVLSRKLVSETP